MTSSKNFGTELEFRGARIALGGLQIDNMLEVTGVAIGNRLDGPRQSVLGRCVGNENVYDSERLAHDPAVRAIVSGEGLYDAAASSSHTGRFNTRC